MTEKDNHLDRCTCEELVDVLRSRHNFPGWGLLLVSCQPTDGNPDKLDLRVTAVCKDATMMNGMIKYMLEQLEKHADKEGSQS